MCPFIPILVVADEFDGAPGDAGLCDQIRTPGRVLGGDHERTPKTARCPCSPAPGKPRKELVPQHDRHPLPDGQRVKDLANVMKKGSHEEFALRISRFSQPLEYGKSMRPFGRLHAQEEGQLGRVEVTAECVYRHGIRGGMQGTAELFDAVADAGNLGQGSISARNAKDYIIVIES